MTLACIVGLGTAAHMHDTEKHEIQEELDHVNNGGQTLFCRAFGICHASHVEFRQRRSEDCPRLLGVVAFPTRSHGNFSRSCRLHATVSILFPKTVARLTVERIPIADGELNRSKPKLKCDSCRGSGSMHRCQSLSTEPSCLPNHLVYRAILSTEPYAYQSLAFTSLYHM